MIRSLIKSSVALAAAGLMYGATAAQAITLNFSAEPGAGLEFNGSNNTFSFIDSGRDFQISGFNAAAGLTGNISGVYQIGAINQVTPTLQVANVNLFSGPNTFTIVDANNVTFGATINWMTIQTDAAVGGINKTGGIVNLTGITYAGNNAALLQFIANSNSGIAVISFDFGSDTSLTELTADGVTTVTGYSGSITSVPDGGLTLALLGMSMMGVEGIRRRMKKA